MSRTADDLLHVTLTTGHVRRSPRSEVADDAIAAVRPLLRRGGGRLPGPFGDYALSAEDCGDVLRFVVRSRATRQALAVCGVARATGPASEALWRELVEIAGECRAPLPDSAPWLGVALRPLAIVADPGACGWLGDFERVVAWAWIEKRREYKRGSEPRKGR